MIEILDLLYKHGYLKNAFGIPVPPFVGEIILFPEFRYIWVWLWSFALLWIFLAIEFTRGKSSFRKKQIPPYLQKLIDLTFLSYFYPVFSIIFLFLALFTYVPDPALTYGEFCALSNFATLPQHMQDNIKALKNDAPVTYRDFYQMNSKKFKKMPPHAAKNKSEYIIHIEL